MPSYRAGYTPAEKKAFGRQLRKLMDEKGLTGAELARQATLKLASKKTIGRDNISWYLNGRSMPTPPYLNAIAKVLDVDPQFLVPRHHTQAPGEAAPVATEGGNDIRMNLQPNGEMHLMLNIRVPRALGWKILQMIEDSNGASTPKDSR
jgi:transcriptional regulator with XRE-family HTH domain